MVSTSIKYQDLGIVLKLAAFGRVACMQRSEIRDKYLLKHMVTDLICHNPVLSHGLLRLLPSLRIYCLALDQRLYLITKVLH